MLIKYLNIGSRMAIAEMNELACIVLGILCKGMAVMRHLFQNRMKNFVLQFC